MSLNRIAYLLGQCGGDDAKFPPTDLYNEGWMIRLVLDWFSNNRKIDHDLSFMEDSDWYSEALLPSAFLARYRGDKLAESWTHADGVIGEFSIGENADGDLTLSDKAKQIVVVEAKMFSKLSAGVKNASYYDQAARNIACIAEVISRAGRKIGKIDNVGFFVLAPQTRIEERVFSKQMDVDSIRSIVKRRVSEYEDQDKESWYVDKFIPVVKDMKIREISWEEVIEIISDNDKKAGDQLQEFYKKCIDFNQFVAKKYA